MINPYKNNGLAMANNFRNRYLDDSELQKPSTDIAKQLLERSKARIDQIVGIKTEAAHGTYLNRLRNDTAEIVRFTSKASDGTEAEKQRIVKIQNVQIDPLQPPKYRHRKVPRGPASPPPQILRSPPRKLTKKDQDDWKVPPCISNWRNPQGYTIPLHMRLSADGRTLQHNTINQHFADNIDSLYIAERQARAEIEQRARIQKSVAYKQYLKKEQELRNAAIRAREEKAKLMDEGVKSEEEDELREREDIRYLRKRELEREERMKNIGSKKKKEIRERERDISEKVALGQAQPTNTEAAYDERLFNTSAGLGAGLTHDDDDNVYDQPLFADRSAVNLHNTREVPDDGEGDEVAKKGMRNEPVKFKKHDDDIFGLGSFVQKKQGDPNKKFKRE